jgi:hypothetical protein
LRLLLQQCLMTGSGFGLVFPGDQARLFVPRVLMVMGGGGPTADAFLADWQRVPLASLLPWAAQMLSLLGEPEGAALLPALEVRVGLSVWYGFQQKGSSLSRWALEVRVCLSVQYGFQQKCGSLSPWALEVRVGLSVQYGFQQKGSSLSAWALEVRVGLSVRYGFQQKDSSLSPWALEVRVCLSVRYGFQQKGGSLSRWAPPGLQVLQCAAAALSVFFELTALEA